MMLRLVIDNLWYNCHFKNTDAMFLLFMFCFDVGSPQYIAQPGKRFAVLSDVVSDFRRPMSNAAITGVVADVMNAVTASSDLGLCDHDFVILGHCTFFMSAMFTFC